MALDIEKLQKKHRKVLTALETLNKALKAMNKVPSVAKCAQEDPKELYQTYRDSLVQRFEYSFDLTWKYLSDYLQFEGKTVTEKTPKSIFREGLQAKILSEPETRLAMKMVDHRNLTTHAYNEAVVEEIVQRIPQYYELLTAIIQRTPIKQNDA